MCHTHIKVTQHLHPHQGLAS